MTLDRQDVIELEELIYIEQKFPIVRFTRN